MRQRWALALLILAASCSSATSSKALLKASSQAPFPAPIIHLAGDGAAMGTAHGEQLGPAIRQLHRTYFARFFDGNLGKQLAMLLASGFESYLRPQHLAEIRALAKQSGMSQGEILLANCFLDAVPMVACSTITLPASASPDGVARFGRNLDFPAHGLGEKSTVLLIFHPEGKFSFASVTWPGMVGVLSGMNEHGLTLANMEVDRTMRLPSAMPYALLYRTVLEECTTVEEAIALLEKTPRQTANNLMLMDADGDRAVCEITPQKVVVRRAANDTALISTNHQRGSDVDAAGRCWRFDQLHDAAEKESGKIGVREVRKMLAGVAQGEMSLQSMIFEPAKRVMYLAAGPNAPSRELVRLDLKPLLADQDSSGFSGAASDARHRDDPTAGEAVVRRFR
jgi:isopenicillin-N N-acyltransferase like protein